MGTPRKEPLSPYAQLEKIFTAVRRHSPTHQTAAIARLVAVYKDDALDNLYAEAVLWAKKFVSQGADQPEIALRQEIANYVLRRGNARRQAQNVRDSHNFIDPAAS
jgi:hypothetical protein